MPTSRGAGLASTHQHGATARIEVRFAERERLVDAQPGAPHHGIEKSFGHDPS
jgi:hypothetical protein